MNPISSWKRQMENGDVRKSKLSVFVVLARVPWEGLL